jgi:hypothetical protein
MRKEIHEYVTSCAVCQLAKFKFRPKHDFLILAPHSTTPFETVHLDYGEIRKKAEGVSRTQSFILLIDEATRMVYTKAINEKTRSLTTWLESLPFLDSVKKVISDNGPSFASKEFGKWTQERNIRQIFSAQYHPQSNSMAERMMRDIKMFFSLYPHFPQGWKKCLEAATLHHNRSYNSSIGCSPLFKLHGVPALFPADEEFGITAEQLQHETPLSNDEIHEKRVKMKDAVNAGKKNIPEIKPGDAILYQAGRDGKGPNVKGPVEVTEVIMKEEIPKTLIIKDDDGKKKAIALNNALPFKRRRTTGMKTNNLLIAVTVCCLLSPAFSIFIRESPVIWLKSKTPLIDKIVTVNHTLAFQSVCTPFLEAQGLTPSNYLDLNVWCYNETEKSLAAYETVCDLKRGREAKPRAAGRKKRFIIAAIFAVTVISFLISTWVVIAENKMEIMENERKIQVLKEENLRSHSYVKSLAADLLNVTLRLDQLEVFVKDFSAIWPNATTLIGSTAAQFQSWKELSAAMAREIQRDRLPPKLFDLFGDSLPNNSITDEATFMSCTYEKKARLLRLLYQMPIAMNGHKLFEAFHFRYLKNYTDPITNTTRTCQVAYHGPTFAVSSPYCVHTMDSTVVLLGRMSYIFDEEAPCSNATDEEQQKYWKKDTHSCVPVHLASRFPAQVMITTQGSYIYCFGRKIRIRGFNFECPRFVFRVPLDTNYDVGKSYHYNKEVHNVNMSEFGLVDHLRIMNHLYPTVNEDPVLKDLEKMIQTLDHEPTFDVDYYFYHPSTFTLLFVLFLFLFCSILYCYCRFKSGSQCLTRKEMKTARTSRKIASLSRGRRGPRSDSMEMEEKREEIGGFLDDADREQSK